MSHLHRSLLCCVAAVVILANAGALLQRRAVAEDGAGDPFDHALHEHLFPRCATCHPGVEEAGAAMQPPIDSCDVCHDGDAEVAVTWIPTAAAPSNLRFDHLEHAALAAKDSSKTTNCASCHGTADETTQLVRADVGTCLDCHEQAPHLALENDCAACHLRLAEATDLSVDTIAGFPAPPSHEAEGFASAHAIDACPEHSTGGHAPNDRCSTCHAREFCQQCHVDALELRSIQSLERDARSLVHAAELPEPASHLTTAFLDAHGHGMSGAQDCATCHTKESCWVCHAATPNVAEGLFRSGPGRAVGAITTRSKPSSHDELFRQAHGPMATASPQSCAACHDRAECLDCHAPSAADQSPGFHPYGFLATHAVDAYARDSSCAECHNPRSFCADCHQTSGLTSNGTLAGAGYHDSYQFFLLGHGPAARRNLESCISCHRENDCLACHSAMAGRRFNPHGPGFDARPAARSGTTDVHRLSRPRHPRIAPVVESRPARYSRLSRTQRNGMLP